MRRLTSWPARAIFWGFCLLVLALLSIPAAAQKKATDFQSLQDRLIADGFDQTVIRKLYARPEVMFEAKGISVYFVYRESKVNYERYTDRVHIEKARDYLREHQAAFAQAQKTYGVDPEVITAIILVETQLGTMLGSRTVLNTLSTMAALSDPKARNQLWGKIKDTPDLTREVFDKKAAQKSGWAYRELKAFLHHAESQGFDPTAIKGSFAGAMGIAQFMPSNIDILAKDGNNDGEINLFDHADAIASIAFYLKEHGWQPGIERKKAAKVIYRYNRSDEYVDAILNVSERLKG
ncbi:MAG: lytic murein transglycosylase [Desulfobacterales bacterium]